MMSQEASGQEDHRGAGVEAVVTAALALGHPRRRTDLPRPAGRRHASTYTSPGRKLPFGTAGRAMQRADPRAQRYTSPGRKLPFGTAGRAMQRADPRAQRLPQEKRLPRKITVVRASRPS